MSKLREIVQRRIGIRTLAKSWYAYSKGKAYKNGRPLSAFVINGNSAVHLAKNVSIVNKGKFFLGLADWGFIESKNPCILYMEENSELVINGFVGTGSGVNISIDKNAVLEIGPNVWINADSKLLCSEHIIIGGDTIIAWDVEIQDSDRHKIIEADFVMSKPIEIGSHVWIGSRATILKGVKIGSGSVVAAGTIVTSDVPENCLVGGVPGKIIKRNVSWEK